MTPFQTNPEKRPFTPLFHLISQHKFLGKYNVFTEEEIELLDDIAMNHSPNLPRTDAEWLEVFPEFKPSYKKLIKTKISDLQQHLKQILEGEREIKQKLTPWLDKAHKDWYEFVLEGYAAMRAETMQAIKRYAFKLSYVDKPNQEEIKSGGGVSDADIARAREFPVMDLYSDKLIKKGKLFTGRCEFHNEKTGSFTVYPNNSWYCYGCAAGGDSIAYVQKQKGISFIEAVHFLTKSS